MNFNPVLELIPSPLQNKKYALVFIYTALVLLITFYFFFYRRRQTTNTQNDIQVNSITPSYYEDSKPKLSINGRAILSNPVQEVIYTLDELSKQFRCYPIFQVTNDGEEDKIKETYQSIKGIPPHRWIFCETELGYRAILRQLTPRLHLEKDMYIAKQMAPYIPHIVMVTEEQCEGFFQLPVFIHSHHFLMKLAKDLLN